MDADQFEFPPYPIDDDWPVDWPDNADGLFKANPYGVFGEDLQTSLEGAPLNTWSEFFQSGLSPPKFLPTEPICSPPCKKLKVLTTGLGGNEESGSPIFEQFLATADNACATSFQVITRLCDQPNLAHDNPFCLVFELVEGEVEKLARICPQSEQHNTPHKAGKVYIDHCTNISQELREKLKTGAILTMTDLGATTWSGNRNCQGRYNHNQWMWECKNFFRLPSAAMTSHVQKPNKKLMLLSPGQLCSDPPRCNNVDTGVTAWTWLKAQNEAATQAAPATQVATLDSAQPQPFAVDAFFAPTVYDTDQGPALSCISI